MKVLLMGAKLFHAEYKWTDVTYLLTALRNFANDPKSVSIEKVLPHRSS